MSKRVYEIAKERGLDAVECAQMFKRWAIGDVRNRMSKVEPLDIERFDRRRGAGGDDASRPRRIVVPTGHGRYVTRDLRPTESDRVRPSVPVSEHSEAVADEQVAPVARVRDETPTHYVGIMM